MFPHHFKYVEVYKNNQSEVRLSV